jgi:hypothetical protein
VHTPAHMLMGAALYGRRQPKLAWAGLVGGLLPDVPMFLMFAAAKLAGSDAHEIFEEAYFSIRWQVANGVGHSLLLWPLLLGLGLGLRARSAARSASILIAFAAAGLTHSIVDFLCHREDAHMQFWPLSSWRFISPLSYYDPAHFGRVFMIGETGAAIACAIWIVATVRNLPARVMAALLTLPYWLAAAWLLS